MPNYELPQVSPLFYEALTGEITVCSDPILIRSLGQILIATYMKGEHNYSGTRSGEIEATYSPSWAPHVISKITARSDQRIAMINSLEISLTGSSAKLKLMDNSGASDANSEIAIVRPYDDSVSFLPLDLRESINNTRQHITEAAQAIFQPTLVA